MTDNKGITEIANDVLTGESVDGNQTEGIKAPAHDLLTEKDTQDLIDIIMEAEPRCG